MIRSGYGAIVQSARTRFAPVQILLEMTRHGTKLRSVDITMPGFDVTQADQRRARGLVVCASLLLSAGLLTALMTSKDTRSEAASLTAPVAAAAPVDVSGARDAARAEAGARAGTGHEDARPAEAAARTVAAPSAPPSRSVRFTAAMADAPFDLSLQPILSLAARSPLARS